MALAAIALVCGLAMVASAQPQPQPQPAPSPVQLRGMSPGVMMFQHFGPCTFLGCQWNQDPLGAGNANSFNFAEGDGPDTDNWMENAQLLGADTVCLTVRHVDGFHLWPTQASNYSVRASPWKNGTGDVVAEFVASARKYNINVCFYIILGFNVYANKTGVQPQDYLRQQEIALTELLTNYGPISRLWWDNYALDGRIYQPVTHDGFVCPGNQNGPACPNWNILSSLVKRISPYTLIVPGPDGCLVNAEGSGGTYPLYLAAPMGAYWCTNPSAPMTNLTGAQFVLTESDFSILNPGDNWFYNYHDPIMDLGDFWSQVTVKRSQGANLIMNIPPDYTGRIPANITAVLQQYHDVYQQTYATPAAMLQEPVYGTCPGLSFVVPVNSSVTFDQILMEEDLTFGQVIAGYTIEAQSASDGSWRLLDVIHGQTVGSRLIDWGLGDVTGVSALRWNCTAGLSNVEATINKFAAYLGAPLS